MKTKIFIVDAFTDSKYGGNPAGVMYLKSWLPDAEMQNIAMENNQAETAFFVGSGNEYHIRWFTPLLEVDLCGHATLAAAHVLFEHYKINSDNIVFNSRSGDLLVNRNEKGITLDFPTDYFLDVEIPEKLLAAFNVKPKEVYIGKTDYLLVFESEEMIKRLAPNFAILKEVRCRGVIATAKSREFDFVYRFFAPQAGIDEDPATGSAQTTLMQYWSKHLHKNELSSMQSSARTGKFFSKINGDRVEISGKAITYLEGEIEI